MKAGVRQDSREALTSGEAPRVDLKDAAVEMIRQAQQEHGIQDTLRTNLESGKTVHAAD